MKDTPSRDWFQGQILVGGKNATSVLEARTQNFQRQMVYWSGAEVEGCAVLTFREKKNEASLLPQIKLRPKWKRIYFLPPKRWTHVNKSIALKRLLFGICFFPFKTNALDKQLCINLLLNPGSPCRALRATPSSSLRTVTARASRPGQVRKPVRARAALPEMHIV